MEKKKVTVRLTRPVVCEMICVIVEIAFDLREELLGEVINVSRVLKPVDCKKRELESTLTMVPNVPCGTRANG
jgi:hypothetical protein